MVGTEKLDKGLQGKMVSFNIQMGIEAERCGDSFLRTRGCQARAGFQKS